MLVRIVALGEKIHNALQEHIKRDGSTYIWKELAGGCAVGSWLLVDQLKKKHGMQATFVASSTHAFAEYGDFIYDVTATQFGVINKVLVTHKSEIHKLSSSWLKSAYTSDTRNGIKHVNEEWPEGQQPRNYRMIWNNQYKATITYHGKP